MDRYRYLCYVLETPCVGRPYSHRAFKIFHSLMIKNQLRKFNTFAYPIHIYRLANCRKQIKLQINDMNVMRNRIEPVA